MSKVVINITQGRLASFEVDGEPIAGVVKFSVSGEPRSVPVVTLDVYAPDLAIELNEADVKINHRKPGDGTGG
jgi:hypothetical protein